MNKLIIVDDERIILDSICKYITNFLPELEICGCFYDGEDALRYMLTHPVDIVITDICMPNMDGLELAKEINDRGLQCIVIIISGYSEFEYARTAIRYNVSNYLLKPLDFKELNACLKSALKISSKKSPVTSNIDLLEEKIEIFFVDLLLGIIPSSNELEKRFHALNFPFTLSTSTGNLIRISFEPSLITEHYHYDIDMLPVSIKNVLQLTLSEGYVYFARKSGWDFYYVIIRSEEVTDCFFESIIQSMNNILQLQCKVSLCHHFDTLNDFIPTKATAEENTEKEKTNQCSDSVITKAIKYIEDNYAQDLSREMVADIVFLSPSHFSYLFKKTTGANFTDYLTNVRMQKAIELLNTRMKIQDIAEKVGYSSRNRFFINFRQYTSYTPSEYRKKVLCLEGILDETEN